MATGRALPNRLLVAIGGNATHPGHIKGTAAEQASIAAETGRALLPLMALDNELIITHGNGPVVGKILMRQALTRDRIAPMPLDICVAHSQGGIAYLLMQALENALRKADNPRHVVCLLTQVEVDPEQVVATSSQANVTVVPSTSVRAASVEINMGPGEAIRATCGLLEKLMRTVVRSVWCSRS